MKKMIAITLIACVFLSCSTAALASSGCSVHGTRYQTYTGSTPTGAYSHYTKTQHYKHVTLYYVCSFCLASPTMNPGADYHWTAAGKEPESHSYTAFTDAGHLYGTVHRWQRRCTICNYVDYNDRVCTTCPVINSITVIK